MLIGWQDDDLPLFGHINDIVVVNGSVLFLVHKYETIGIDRHYHSYCIQKKCNSDLYWLSELVDYYPYQGHALQNGCIYITFRSYIEH